MIHENDTLQAEKMQIPEFTISLKTKTASSERYQITSSSDVSEIARKCFDADTLEWVESFIVIALNRAKKVLGFYKVSSGGITGTIADPRIIFQFALLSNATDIIIAHNHPSGNLKPSRADEEMTKQISEAGKVLQIKVLDHIIVSAEGYYSFMDEGMMY